MTEENESSSWMIKGFIVLFLAIILTSGVFILLMLFPWIPPEWIGLTLLLSFLVFLAGGGIFLENKDTRLFLYSFTLGWMIGIGCIIIATLRALSYIPIPFFGNALYATAAVCMVITLLLLWLRPTEQDIVQTGPITTSSKSFADQKQTIQRLFMQNTPETILALELVEEPHDYIFSDTEDKSPSVPIERFSSLVRTLFSTPFTICYQQHNSNTRVYFMTWSKDEAHISHQRTVLLDAIQYNLPSFKFEVLNSFTGIELGEYEKGSAAIITGVPLTIEDESQSKDPLESIVGVLRELENGIFQIFVEPAHLGKSNLKKLEEQYKSEVMRSETVISKERSGLLQGNQQESRTSVNMEAKKKAEILDRRIKRLSESNLYKTTVIAVTWGPNITKVDMDARRMAISLIGVLRPDSDKEPFRVEYTTKRNDIERLMMGFPVGKSTILTAGEVTNYIKLTRRDIGLSISKREKFSSGMKETSESTESETTQGQKITSLVHTNAEWIKRASVIYLGHPLDMGGKVLFKSYVTCRLDFLKMHLGVVGHTQSG
ncbi:MAG: hypothetical protein E4H14_16030, partial [Candidatus Thorarchaeota archaeon]